MELDVAGLGYSCVDELLLLSELPPAEGRATVLRREQQGGGMVPTAMVAVARLGGRAGFAGKVGDDATGDAIATELADYGVDLSRLVRQPGATSHRTVVLVDRRTGARTFLSQRGTVEALRPEELDRDYLTAAVLHLSDAGPASLQAARWARAAGRRVCLDGTRFRPAFIALAPHVDYLIVSRAFAGELAAYEAAGSLPTPDEAARDVPLAGGPPSADPAAPGRAGHAAAGFLEAAARQLPDLAQRLQQLGPRGSVAVVTDGERGSWCASDEGAFHVPAYPVEVVDTTGAGDVFHGAFLFAVTRGWSLRRSLAIASAAAALKCRALGGRAGIPRLEEALALAGGAD